MQERRRATESSRHQLGCSSHLDRGQRAIQQGQHTNKFTSARKAQDVTCYSSDHWLSSEPGMTCRHPHDCSRGHGSTPGAAANGNCGRSVRRAGKSPRQPQQCRGRRRWSQDKKWEVGSLNPLFSALVKVRTFAPGEALTQRLKQMKLPQVELQSLRCRV
ncbi:hypothetical protein RRG08_056620 [Elysia crispata]|uniref:Uncharacterized protein n=1 Tax=Elysia crispata TaxID=231223 RepID=A0AAE1E8F9_9GAST|nr:hypothetical protein RRG08_056620 [Elysia crispata]